MPKTFFDLSESELKQKISELDVPKELQEVANTPLNLPEIVHKLLLESDLTLATAESCTAGLISSTLASFSGASKYFLGSAVTYSNQSKQDLINVKPETLEQYGAVSEQTALEMATGVRKIFNSYIAVSVTGIAGPEGGTTEKPVGTVCFGIANENQSKAFRLFFPGDRNWIRNYSTYFALNLIRFKLL